MILFALRPTSRCFVSLGLTLGAALYVDMAAYAYTAIDLYVVITCTIQRGVDDNSVARGSHMRALCTHNKLSDLLQTSSTHAEVLTNINISTSSI